jgi:hypothetical protein
VPTISDFLTRFRDLHARAKKSFLSKEDEVAYERMRGELARLVGASQHLVLKPGETVRNSLRAAHAVKVEIDIPDMGKRSFFTLDISAGGFATLMPTPRAVGEQSRVVMSTGKDTRIEGLAKVVSATPIPTGMRVSYAFTKLEPEELRRLENVVIDAILAQLPQ